MPEQPPTLPRRSIYGLTVEADLDLPELCMADRSGTADLVIRRGDVPSVWEETDPLNTRTFADGEPEHIWLRFPDAVCMEIREGRSISYALEPGAKEDAARLFLLGSGLGAALMQRGFVVVHGNAITRADGRSAIVCIGESGAGKSTTAIAMMQRGYAILADDICPIGLDGQIGPGMPRAKLWEETAGHLRVDTSGLAQVRDGDAKFNLPLGDLHCNAPRDVGAFVWLVPGDVDEVQCVEVHGVEKFTVLRNNIYRPEYLPLLELESTYLKRLAQIASEKRVFKLIRPRSKFDIDPLLDTVSLLYDQCEGAAAPNA